MPVAVRSPELRKVAPRTAAARKSSAAKAKKSKGPVTAAELAPSAPGLFVGTSGWAYPTWKPGFYPEGVSARGFLHFYSSVLTAVEVNYTFRNLPTKEQLAGWLESVLPGFRFSFKTPQAITHFARLKDCDEPVRAFLAAIEPARKAGRLGPLLVQLPPNFRRTEENMARLEAFLALPAWGRRRLHRLAFEFRHESWFDSAVYRLLKRSKAALCIADTDDLQTPELHTAAFAYYRQRRDGGYTDAELHAMAERFAREANARETFVFFRHQDEPTGALNALMLQRAAAPPATEVA